MSNGRSFRRGLKVKKHARPGGQEQQRGEGGKFAEGHVPWNKGAVLTTRPTYGTVGRWLKECVDEGLMERKVREPDGKPGRPPFMYRATEEGRKRAGPPVPPAVRKLQQERLRRWENAKRMRAEVRAEKARAQAAREGRSLAASRRKLADLQRRLTLAEMIYHATKALAEADGDASVLCAEEIVALTENGLAVRDGDRLVLSDDWNEEFRRILRSDRADARRQSSCVG